MLDAGVLLSGSDWSAPGGTNGYPRQLCYAAPGSGTNTATWTFAVEPGQYRVSATWADPHPVWATNSPFTVLDGATVKGTTLINQEVAPNDETEFGVSWEILGTFSIDSNTLTVRLSDLANGFVNADAIRIERLIV